MSPEDFKINEQYLNGVVESAFIDTNFDLQEHGPYSIGQNFICYKNQQSNSVPVVSFVSVGTMKSQCVWKCVYSDLQKPEC